MAKIRNLIVSTWAAATVGLTTGFAGVSAMAGPTGNFGNMAAVPFDQYSFPNVENPLYKQRLQAIHPKFPEILQGLMIPPGKNMRDQGLAGAMERGEINPRQGYILAFAAPKGEVLFRFTDIDLGRKRERGTGATVTVVREMVSNEEQFKQMQAEGSISKFAPWVGGQGGQYIVGAFKAIQTATDTMQVVDIPDPYKYLDPSLNAAQKKQALANFNPTMVGLQEDPLVQVVTGAENVTGSPRVPGIQLPRMARGGFTPGVDMRPLTAPAPGGQQEQLRQAPTGTVFRGPGG